MIVLLIFVLHLGLGNWSVSVGRLVGISLHRQIQSVFGSLHQLPGLLEAQAIQGDVVDLLDNVTILKIAILVRHTSIDDVFDVDLAAQNNSKVFFLLVLVQRHLDGLRFRR